MVHLLEYYFIQDRGNIHVLSLQYGWTPLHFAAATGQLDIILYLNDHGADIHKQDKYGRLPYHLTAQQGYGAAVETFQMLCVNPLITDNVSSLCCVKQLEYNIPTFHV